MEREVELGFKKLKIIQNEKYFCFGTDSVLLANFVESNSSKNIIVDFCSGSGVIPVIMSYKKKYSKMFGVELQPEMYELFEKNIKLNNLEEDIFGIYDNILNTKEIRKKIMQVTNSDKVDIIVCNPPYKKVGTGVLHENNIKNIARHEISCKLEDVFLASSKLLKYKGKLYLVHKPERLTDLLAIARDYKFEAKRLQFIYPKLNAKPSIVLVEYIKDGGNELNVLEPIIEYEENGQYTKQFLDIYGLDKKGIDNIE